MKTEAYTLKSYLMMHLQRAQKLNVIETLEVLEEPKQETLCCSLLDYLEFGEVKVPTEQDLAYLFAQLIGVGVKNGWDREEIIRPLSWPKHKNRKFHNKKRK